MGPASSSSSSSFGGMWSLLLTFLVAVALCLPVSLLWGEEQERKVWAASPSTLDFYTTDEVCVDEDTGLVLNCGHCGQCSNHNDVKKYHQTRHNLTWIMTECARGAFLLGQDPFHCLQSQVHLTNGCAQCWVENYECNIQNCFQTCFKERFFPFLPPLTDWEADPLSNCHACDERLCGPAFIQCAGANRRRVGVFSDIERDTHREICDKVSWESILEEDVTEHHGVKLSSSSSPTNPEQAEEL